MKLKIIGEGKHQIMNDMLIFDTKEGQVEIDFQSAKEITCTLLDALFFTNTEINEICDMIDDKLIERGDL